MKRVQICLLALSWIIGAWSAPTLLANDATATAPTHKQLRTIKPTHDGTSVMLLHYVVDRNGSLWLSVSNRHQLGGRTLHGPAAKDFSGIQVYDTDGQLKAEYPLGFAASAVSLAPDGSLFVAGQGKMAHMSATGEVLAQAATPNIGDLEEYKSKVVQQAIEQRKQFAEQYQQQFDVLVKQAQELEKIKKENRSRTEEARLEMLRRQVTVMKQVIKNAAEPNIDVESTLLRSLTVPGLAATAEHVFVTVRSSSGRGYEVWRTNHEFADAKMVRSGLSGCCGNMDIQPREEGFVACENTKFEVVSYSPDGERLASFGRRDRTAPDGFGSCCNPMNCLSLENGEYVVAESSIGNIKRFSAEGEFLGIVGKARITGGCKHVSLGFDKKLNRFYMMNQDKNHICVLVPLAEAPAVTAEEKQAQEARDGLGKKLIGAWHVAGATKKSEDQAGASTTARIGVASLRKARSDDSLRAEFNEDGSAAFEGGIFAQLGQREWNWECVRQSDDELDIALLLDGVEFQTLRIKFLDDRHLTISNSPYFVLGKVYARDDAPE